MFAALLRELREDPFFRDALAASKVLPARPAACAPAALPEELAAAVQRLCPGGLYTHQAEALRHARSGVHVVVATPTASGKTLCFNLPVVEEVLAAAAAGQRAHALYLFPLKALEQDQLQSLHRLRDAIGLHESFTAAILDGDTRDAQRRRLRAQPPDILLSNPDMLHASILPAHPQWAGFFAGLRYVVLDELHTYRGVFGSHVLHVLRRLRRIAAHYGAAPQFLCASATIGNPRELATALFGVPFTTLEESGAPQGPRHLLLLNPADNALGFAATLFARCLRAGIKTIAFCKSRRATELLYAWTVERHPELRDVTSAYRSGYLPEERREIEAALFGGRLRGVVSTSALELGIDVGGLDAAILVGYPGSIMSTWQRGGRAGRGTSPAGVFLVAGADALDQYYATKPAVFFAAPAEPAVVDPANPTIAAAHLLCAAAELPLTPSEPAYADLDWPATRRQLLQRGLLLQSAGAELWVPLVPNPHREVDIRQIGETYTIHPLADERQVIGTVGGARAFAECHEGAIYLHRGMSLQVVRLDPDRRRVTVDDADGSYYTMPRSAKQTEILSVLQSRPLGATHVHFGRLRITQRITGYERRSTIEQKLLGVFELELPPTIYETEGLWIEAAAAATLDASGYHRMGSLHGLEHALIALAPLHTLCDAADLGGITFVEHPQVPGGAVFVYDAYPGGLGLAARTFEILPQLLDAVLERITRCRCESGCPGCVHSPRCGAGNYPLDKPGTAGAIRLILGRVDAVGALAGAGRAEPAPAGGPEPTADEAPVPFAPPGAGAPSPAATVLSPAPGPRVVYFDLETLRSAADVGGWQHIDRMGMALGVVFDSQRGEFTTYAESAVTALLEHLQSADLIVGYNLLRFDYQVLSAYAQLDFDRWPTFDMLVALRAAIAQRVSLANLGHATLGRGKSADGLQSLRWVREGRLDLVEQYCRDDVALTRDLFEHALAADHLAFESGGRILRTPPLGWKLQRLVQDAARRRAARVRGGPESLFGPPPVRPQW